MSDTTAAMLQDRLNDIERNAYDGIDFRQALNEAYTLADELQAENAKLVDVLHEVETEAVYAYQCLQQDCVTTANSSEHFFKKWWHAECELDRAKAENAKLRKLGCFMLRCMKRNSDCDYCLANGEHCEISHIEADALGLGIEVTQ